LIVIATLVVVIVPTLYFYQFSVVLDYPWSKDQGIWSEFGSFLGGTISPILSFITIFLLIQSLNHQNEANKQLTEQLKSNIANEKMSAKESNKIVELEVLITRFNTFTGNGRLRIKGKNETIAFGITAYKVMNLTTRKLFSKNLDDNNGITEEEEMKYLKIKATSLQKRDGDVVKYLIREASFIENLIRETSV